MLGRVVRYAAVGHAYHVHNPAARKCVLRRDVLIDECPTESVEHEPATLTIPVTDDGSTVVCDDTDQSVHSAATVPSRTDIAPSRTDSAQRSSDEAADIAEVPTRPSQKEKHVNSNS